MQTITSDTWDDELWGVTTDQNQSVEKTSLYFLFGRNDRWVADETRDDLIATRAGASGENGDWKPKMEVDEMGLPHGFCIGEYYPSLFLRWSRDDDADSKEGSVPRPPTGKGRRRRRRRRRIPVPVRTARRESCGAKRIKLIICW